MHKQEQLHRSKFETGHCTQYVPVLSLGCLYKRKKREQQKGCSLVCWHYLFSRAVTRKVFSAQMSLTTVFGMGTGGPSL